MITAAGDTPHAAFAAMLAQRPFESVRPDDGLAVASIEAFDAKRYTSKKWVADLSRTSQLACSATAASARGIEGVAAENVGVVFGSAWGSVNTVIEFEREAHVQGARFVDPILFTETVSNVPAGQVAIMYGWSAFNATVSAGSASGLASLRQALAFLEEGRGSVAIAGGGDAMSLPVLRALRTRQLAASRAGSLPLAEDRSGPVGGEGACFLTLESESHARGRGARAIARILASHGRFVPGAAPDLHAARGSMAELIRCLAARAELSLTQVDLIVLSVSGLLGGDTEEAGAVLDVFGGGPSAAPVMAPKSIFGETWGASGVLAAALAIEAMRTSTVPAAPHALVLAGEFEGLNVPRASLRRSMRKALILDRTDSGHQLGMVLSLLEPHDPPN